jgi:ABC-type multidrug transport system fused ATPase/permease subunit
MAPVGIATVGFLAIIQAAIAQYLKIRGNKDAKLAEEPSRVASEAIDHHRTVQSLGRERYFVESFSKLNSEPHKRAVIRGIIQSLTFAFQSGYMFFNFAAAYRFGVFLIHKGEFAKFTILDFHDFGNFTKSEERKRR